MSQSVNLNQPESLDGKTALHAATTQENNELVRFLIQNNCKINAEDREGKTALFEAIKSRNKAVVRDLVAAGGVIKAPQNEITSLLLKCVFFPFLRKLFKNSEIFQWGQKWGP